MYFADDRHVFYEHHKLSIPANDSLYSFYVGDLHQQPYLYNPPDGTLFVESTEFPKENAPYTVISRHGAHVNQALFLSKNGIYYHDTKDEEVKKAGENPFLGAHFKEIAPLVFWDGTRILYLESSEVWNNGRTDKSLRYRATHLYQLEGGGGNWEELGAGRRGAVWKNAGQLYYFDALGASQLIHRTIYKIADAETAQILFERLPGIAGA